MKGLITISSYLHNQQGANLDQPASKLSHLSYIMGKGKPKGNVHVPKSTQHQMVLAKKLTANQVKTVSDFRPDDSDDELKIITDARGDSDDDDEEEVFDLDGEGEDSDDVRRNCYTSRFHYWKKLHYKHDHIIADCKICHRSCRIMTKMVEAVTRYDLLMKLGELSF